MKLFDYKGLRWSDPHKSLTLTTEPRQNMNYSSSREMKRLNDRVYQIGTISLSFLFSSFLHSGQSLGAQL